jgi:hypothetical protein
MGNTNQTFRNRIINGAMMIDQRNAGAALTMGTSAAGTYGLDRWAGYTGTGSLWQMQRVSTGNLDFPYAMRMQRIAAQTSTSAIYYSQIIETVNTYGLAGQSITLSFYVTAGANYSGGSGFGFQIVNGTAADQGTSSLNTGSWTGAAYPGTTLTPTTTRTLVTYTTTLGASVQELAVRFYWAGSGTAGANDYVDITGVQLEAGTTATPFEMRSYGTELALCQRYYEVLGDNVLALYAESNATSGTFAIPLSATFAAQKRAAPTMSTTGSFTTLNTTGSLAFNSSVSGFSAYYLSAAAGRAFWYNASGGKVIASIEL